MASTIIQTFNMGRWEPGRSFFFSFLNHTCINLLMWIWQEFFLTYFGSLISLILWTLKMCLLKNFLNLAFRKLLFGFWVKFVGSALGTRLGFVRGETIVTVVRMWNVIKIKISLPPPSCVFLLSCAVPEPTSFNVVVRDRLLSGTSLERIKGLIKERWDRERHICKLQ